MSLSNPLVSFIYRREFRQETGMAIEHHPVKVGTLLWKSLLVSAAMIAFFFAGWPVAEVALAAGALAAVLSAWAAVLSNVVSNVPAVLVFTPVAAHLPDPRHAWLVLVMSCTLAGNLTVLGSVANLIVVERVRREANISFWRAPAQPHRLGIGLLSSAAVRPAICADSATTRSRALRTESALRRRSSFPRAARPAAAIPKPG